MPYVVRWDNEHACGTLPGQFDTEEEAEQAGESWLAEMIAMDDDPVAAADAYSYEVCPLADSEEE